MITLAANMKTGHSNQQAFFCPVLYTLTMFKDEGKNTMELGFSGGRLLERLIQEPGQVIDRDTLVAYAWADRIVGPGSLNQQIYTLRKMLGDEKTLQIIQTVPRRGYRFNPAFIIESSAPPASQPPAPVLQAPAAPRVVHSRIWRKAMSVTAPLVAIGAYFFTLPSTELHASLQAVGQDSVMYVGKKLPKVKELMSTTRNLSERMVRLSEQPVDLAIVSAVNGYYHIQCSYSSGTLNTLVLHHNEINSVSDTRLQGCVE